MNTQNIPKLAFLAGPRPEALQACEALKKRYEHVAPEEADILVALGGDGFMLDVLKRSIITQKPVYGMNKGTVGFLMNAYDEEELYQRLQTAILAGIHPLHVTMKDSHGRSFEEYALNEVALLRQTHQSARIRITVDGQIRLEKLVADGVLVATPAGSTAYNHSAHGPILPLDARILALTPISAFRPRRWRGALLPYDAEIMLEILDSDHRPVSATADNREHRDAIEIVVKVDRTKKARLMFDSVYPLNERIFREQFIS